MLPPGADIQKGRAAIQSFLQGVAQQLGDFRLTTTEVKPLGEGWARELGTFTARPKSGGGDIAGKYVVLWRKSGKSWQLATDIWNASK
jgi:ketosteroid isomerase-like protein